MNVYIPLCPACGAAFNIDGSVSQIICEYCRSPIIIENAQLQGTPSSDGNPTVFDKIQSGYDLLDLGQFERAYRIFYDLVDIYPNNYRVWWGLVLAGTNNLISYIGNDQIFRSEAQNALRFSPKNESFEIENKYNDYVNRVNSLMAEQYQNDARRNQFYNPSPPSWKQKPTKKGFWKK